MENSVLRNLKTIIMRKRNLNQEMVSQAQIYKDTAEQLETDAAEIRQKAAKLRTKEKNELVNKAVNSTQPSTS
jgi:hypothetical protein